MLAPKKESNFLKDLLLILVISAWAGAMYESFVSKYDIPVSVEIGFLMVMGFVFGTKTLEAILNWWKGRK